MKSDCIIFVGGDFQKLNESDLNRLKNAYIICADNGYKYALKYGFKPDCVLGDFDSLGYKPNLEGVLVYPIEKDDTDLMIAVKAALEMGYEKISIYGALGGRLDHMLGNIQALCYVLEHGGQAEIVSEKELVTMVCAGKYEIDYRKDFSLSLISYSEKVGGLSIRGVKYPLENAEISSGFPLGLSNKITAEKAEITFESGELLIIQSYLFTDLQGFE